MTALFVLAALFSGVEIVNEPVLYVVNYEGMEAVDLRPEDVVVYSETIPRIEMQPTTPVKSVTVSLAELEELDKDVVVDQLMDELVEEEGESRPNEDEEENPLAHVPIILGTVEGNVHVLGEGTDKRLILVTDITGEGIMELIIKGGTGWTATELAEPVLVTPPVKVLGAGGVSPARAENENPETTLPPDLYDALSAFYGDTVPTNLKTVPDPIAVTLPEPDEEAPFDVTSELYAARILHERLGVPMPEPTDGPVIPTVIRAVVPAEPEEDSDKTGQWSADGYSGATRKLQELQAE